MRKSYLAGVSAIALVWAASTTAQAGGMGDEWYVSMFGGISIPEVVNGDLDYFGDPFTVSTELDNGFIVGLAAGTYINESLRGEIEFAFASNDPSSWLEIRVANGATFPYTGIGGSLDSYTILGNVWYDIDVNSDIKPFVGGGVGVGFIGSDMQFEEVGGPSMLIFDDCDTAFAFQAGAGVNYAITPDVYLHLSYRFRGLVGFDLDETGGVFMPFSVDDQDLYSHNIVAGVKVNTNVLLHSDRRLKRDIRRVGQLGNGLGLYSYRYHWSDVVFVGVIAQEVEKLIPEAVVMQSDGYLAVDYGMLGIRMMTLAEWQAAGEEMAIAA